MALALLTAGMDPARAFYLAMLWPSFAWALARRMERSSLAEVEHWAGISPSMRVVHVHRVEIHSEDPDRFVHGTMTALKRMQAEAEEITRPGK